MKEETVVGAHAFTDDVSSLMLRLKGHLREGGLDVCLHSISIEGYSAVSMGLVFSIV